MVKAWGDQITLMMKDHRLENVKQVIAASNKQ